MEWSQLYQAQVVYADTFTALNNSLISGITLWAFADITTDQSYEQANCNFELFAGETLCENNKGAVDYWRRYTRAYYVAQGLFANFAE